MRLPSSIACRQQKRNVEALEPKRSSSCVGSPPLRRGTTSCIASTSAKRSRPDWRIFERAACTLTPPSEKNLSCREHHLVGGSPEVSAIDSEVHRRGFRVLCRANGGTDHRASGARLDVAKAGTPRSRVSRRTPEGSARVTVSNHLRIFRTGVAGCDDRPLQGAAREGEARQCRVKNRAEPVTTANARTGPAILDGASPIAPAFSSRKTACALVRARLTSDVRRK